jgi:hypothetical protein
MTAGDDEAAIAALLRAFALATDRAVPREMAAFMCADEAENFLDNIPESDWDDDPVLAGDPDIDILGIRFFGDLALARFSRPHFASAATLVCRCEHGRWTVCADAEDELTLDQLEDVTPQADPLLDAHVRALRRIPVGALTTEDTRVLLTHRQGFGVLLPRVAVQLQWEPLLAARTPGDLLAAVLDIDREHWAKDPVSRTRVRLAVDKLRGDGAPLAAALRDRIAAFLSAPGGAGER